VRKLFVGNNRFYVRRGSEKEFERIWTNRESFLQESEGFISINLLRGTTTSESTLYISNSIWKSRIDFENWKNSDNFKLTVKTTTRNKALYIGFPNFEGLQEVDCWLQPWINFQNEFAPRKKTANQAMPLRVKNKIAKTPIDANFFIWLCCRLTE